MGQTPRPEFIKAEEKYQNYHMSSRKDNKRIFLFIIYGILIGAPPIFLSLYFTPDFVADIFSPDGVLHDSTIKKINIVRIAICGTGLAGVAIFLLFATKPGLLSLLKVTCREKTGINSSENSMPERSSKHMGINPHVKSTIICAPVLIMLFYAVFLYIPFTRHTGLLLLEENNLIELSTFVFFAIGGIYGLRFAMAVKKSGDRLFVYGFYLIFSFCLFIIALEEIAWGQWLLGFETPEVLKGVNRQGETTLHNIGWLQGHSEIMRLTFGVGGMVGICLFFHPSYRKIGVPPVLLPWFAVVIFHASIDVINDIYPMREQFDYFMQRTSELVELLIAISAFLYILLNYRNYKMSTDQ